MKIMALDVATKTGWCYGDTETGIIASGVLDFAAGLPKRGNHDPGKLLAAIQGLNVLMDEHMPEIVVIESPFSRGKASQILAKLAGMAEAASAAHGAGVAMATATQVRKGLWGNGGMSTADAKARSIAECRSQGIEPSTDDEADAVALWLYAQREFSETKEAAA